MGDKPTVPPVTDPPPPGEIEVVLCLAIDMFGESAPFDAVGSNILAMWGFNGTDPMLDEANTTFIQGLVDTNFSATLGQMKTASQSTAGVSLSPELANILNLTPENVQDEVERRQAPITDSKVLKTRDALIEQMLSQSGMPNPAATVNDKDGILGKLTQQAALIAGTTGGDLGKFAQQLGSAIPTQNRSASWTPPGGLNFMGLPLSDIVEYMNGDVLSAKLSAAAQLELHFWLAGDVLNNVGGLVLYKYSDMPESTEGEGWLDQWNLNEIVTVSAFHAAGLDELLKQATIKDPDHPLAPSTTPVAGTSPLALIFRHRSALMGGFHSVLREYYEAGRTKLVANLNNEHQLFDYVLNDAGFGPSEERNGYTFRILDLAVLFEDTDPVYKEVT